jgi:hypothetical protein
MVGIMLVFSPQQPRRGSSQEFWGDSSLFDLCKNTISITSAHRYDTPFIYVVASVLYSKS